MADNPITREEQYLAYLNRQGTAIPYPITRTEQFLYELCMNGGLGGGTSINILGELASTSELPSTDAEKGDAYIINGELWVYSGSTLSSAVNGFSNCGRFTAGNDGQDGEDGEDGTDGFSPTVTENPSNTPNDYRLDITTISGTFTTPNLIGAQGQQGIQGERGEQGETGLQGQQGIQGVKGEKGDDGYPFLIYKQYEVGLEEFNEADYPEIGLMFMVHVFEEDKGYPVYRYTADGTDTPYSLVTYMNTEGIKGEKGDKGEDGAQGIAGLDGKDGKDGTTYTPSIGEVTTVESNIEASASVSIKEETKEAVFNFAVPKGRDGIDGTDGTPVGCVFPFAGINLPVGYLACNGASYKVAEYPDLYAVIGNTYGGDSTNFNVPDYRETVLVGVGENTTDTITSHDVYELGEFKDDQLQSHTHNVTIPNTINGSWSVNPTGSAGYSSGTKTQTSTVSGTGTTTHGKQKGVTYIIKAR